MRNKKNNIGTVNIPNEVKLKMEVLETEYPGVKDCVDKYFLKFKKNNIDIVDVVFPNKEGHKMVQIHFLETTDKKKKIISKKMLCLLFSEEKWDTPRYLN